jgi:hypothetical protein
VSYDLDELIRLEKAAAPSPYAFGVVAPPHTYRECSDGSLEIRASIGDMHDGISDGWHGYLDEGHEWRVARDQGRCGRDAG